MESPNTPKVFITHSWHDIDIARKLYTDLVARGYEVWFDDKTMQGGHRMAEEINRGLEWCDVYLPILSPESLDSPWCWEEINAAISLSNEKARNGQPRVIPILVKSCQVPAILRGRLFINLAERYPNEITKVYSAIDTYRLERERQQREQVQRERTVQLAREKTERQRDESERAQLEKQAREQALAERSRIEKAEREQKTKEKAEKDRLAEQNAAAGQAAGKASSVLTQNTASRRESFFKKSRYLVVPAILGNISWVIIVLFWFFLPNSISILLDPILGFLILVAIGIFAAFSHKPTAANFRIGQAVRDGFWGGLSSSIIVFIVSFLASFFILFSLKNSGGNVILAFAALFVGMVLVPFVSAIIGSLGGFTWGIAYSTLIANRR